MMALGASRTGYMLKNAILTFICFWIAEGKYFWKKNVNPNVDVKFDFFFQSVQKKNHCELDFWSIWTNFASKYAQKLKVFDKKKTKKI